MRINTDQLPRTLEKTLAPVWLVAGDEPLLIGEAADAIRARARAAGYSGRDMFFVERYFEWSELLASTQALSLFAERRIIEVRMPSPRPGKEGGAVLAKLVADPAPDTLLLAERVEGNLLAAHQEIEKLALSHAGGEVTTEDVLDAVANSARYDVFQLGEAALDGDASRSLRILTGLRTEGAEPALVLWALCRDLRALAERRRNPDAAPGHGRQAERRAALIARAVERNAGQSLAPFFISAGRVDRQIKGLRRGDPWTGFTGLGAAFSGVALPETPVT